MGLKCNQSGRCCKLFLVDLNEEEYKSEKFETELGEFGMIDDFKLAKEAGANILKRREDGACVYLEDNLCSIHENRPKVCKGFFCNSKAKKWQGMIKEVDKFEKLIKIDVLKK